MTKDDLFTSRDLVNLEPRVNFQTLKRLVDGGHIRAYPRPGASSGYYQRYDLAELSVLSIACDLRERWSMPIAKACDFARAVIDEGRVTGLSGLALVAVRDENAA